MFRTNYYLGIVLVFFLSSSLGIAQGFTCADAIEILDTDVPYFYSGTTVGAGNDYTSGMGCNDNNIDGEDFVFHYISPGNEVIRANLQAPNGTTNFFSLYIFDGCPDDVSTSCLYHDVASGTDSAFIETIHFVVADTYYFVVSSWPGATFNYDFELFLDRPIGNICENALVIPSIASEYTYTGTTRGYGDDYSDGRGCNNTYINANDFVFEYSSPGNEVLRFNLQNLDSLANYGLYIMEGCPDDPTSQCFAFDDADWPDSAFIETVHFDTAGTYYIIVADWDNGPDYYNFKLHIDRPIGNICENALIIPSIASEYTYIGTTRGYGDDYSDGRGCNSTYINANDFVFEYSSPGNEVLRFNLQNLDSLANYGLYIMEGCPDDPTSQCFAFDDADWPDSAFIETVHFDTAGTYFIIVADWDNGPDYYNFKLHIDRPIGNICENALVIPTIVTDYTYVGTTRGYGDDYSDGRGCNSTYINANDFVFEYSSPGNEVLRFALQNLDSLNNFGLYIMEGCPDDPTSQCFAFDDSDYPDSAFIQTVHFDTAGTYYIIVADWDNGPVYYDFELYIDRPVGNICEFAEVIPSFDSTFSFVGTTYGRGNDYLASQGCNNFFLSANEFVFEYTSPGDEVLRMTLHNLDSFNNFGMYVIDGCPNDTAATCLYGGDGDWPDSALIETIHFENPGTYYFVISCWTGSGPYFDFELFIDRPKGNICENAIPVTSLPYQDINSTYALGNDYTASNGCNNFFLSSNEIVYEYYAEEGAYINISLENINVSNNFAIYLLDGCPDDGGTCVASVDGDGADSIVLDITSCLTEGYYYIILSSWLGSSAFYDFELNITGFTADISATEMSGINDDDIICFDQAGIANVNLVASGMGGNIATDYGYAWSTTETISSINKMPLTTTLYMVTLTDDNGCKAYEEKTISINPELTATIDEMDNSGSSNDKTLCFDDIGSSDATLTAMPVGGSTAYSYEWDNPGNATTSSIAESPASSTMYTVTITDQVGCQTTQSEQININPEIDLTASSFSDAGRTIALDTICFSNAGSQTVYFEGIASGGSGGFNYLWNDDAMTSSALMQDMPSVSRNYSVTATDNKGCEQDDATLITINAEITLDMDAMEDSAIPNDDHICLRDAGMEVVTIDASTSGGSGSFIYEWGDASTENPLIVLLHLPPLIW